MKHFEKPVAWVVGGSKGLGVMVVKGLAEDGYRIAINYRQSRTAAQKLGMEIENRGGEVLVIQGDVSQVADVRRMTKEIEATWGRIDALVCAAGPFIFKRTPLTDFTDDEWQEMIAGNLSGVFYLIREVIPMMRKQGGGRVITFGFPEAESIRAWSGYGSYAVAKTGLVSLTKTLAAEEIHHHITVNMVNPGDIRDPFKEATIKEARNRKDPRTPAGRPGTGEDVARIVRFLLHPDSDFITGAVIPVTGGFVNE
ncbi:SDR family oxidoreductase [Thermoactinomyces mirandus]|uniref:SDR family oxidoreductase n=1 Tax=Thermoactinomyces mirandus TaxID=2756294 RepID=A0A7W1XTL0_9BACL|nr:SDR family oxidoreductase [Thermoactinomyces mirandus]MBA4603042.1 SDR family oxidoreductase [Thermoactinomyces mirandus]